MSEPWTAGIIIRSREEWLTFTTAVLGGPTVARLFPAPATYPVAVALPLLTVSISPIARWLEAKDWPPGVKEAADAAPFDAQWVERLYDDMRAFAAERNASMTADLSAWLEKRRAPVTERSPEAPASS